MELELRRLAVTEVIDAFRDREVVLGKSDCVRMAAANLRAMGHSPKLAAGGGYSTIKGAVAALRRAGFDSLEAALDARFDRQPPARCLPGDLVTLESDFPLSALGVCVGSRNVLCTWQGQFAVIEPLAYVAAWHVPCLRGLS